MLSIVEKCKLAKVDRTVYYDALKNPEFVKFYHKTSVDFIKHAIGPMACALVKEAVRGSAPHLKMGLEIAEVLTETPVLTESYAERLRRLGKSSS